MKKIIVAIDGHSSCGKSTMAKQLATTVGYTYIDTGAMYRAVALFAIKNKLFENGSLNEERLEQAVNNLNISFQINPKTNLPETSLNGENVEHEIRNMEVASKVSQIAAVPFVREKLVKLQQQMGLSKGIVMDGRDIGTVVFPNAELKIFVTAAAEIRAKRRWNELTEKGEKTNFEEILDNVTQRDKLDSTRKESPLRPADDAIILDNSSISIEEQARWLVEMFNKAQNA